MTPRRIIWHHSASAMPGAQFDVINEWHRQRGFEPSRAGYYVGYHFVIERDGQVRRAREDDELGSHDAGENLDSLGICLAGDFTAALPTEAQARSAAALVAAIRKRWPIPITRIEPHRQDDQTECPGRAIPDGWLVETYLTRGGNLLHKVWYSLGKQIGLLH